MSRALTSLCSIALILCALASPVQANTKVILQLPWTHQFEFAGFYAAKEKGFFDREGLDVEIRTGRANQAPISEVLSGNADFGVSASELLLARTSGQPVVALGVIFQHSASGLMALAENNIYTPQDFIAGSLEMGALSNDAESHAMLQAEGITPRQYERIPSTFSMEKLINKEVNATSIFITNQPFYLEQQNIPYRLILPRSYGIDFYGDTLFTREKLIEEHPEVVKGFHHAAMRGWRYAFERPDEIIDVILEKYSDYPFAHSREHLKFEYNKMKELILPDLIEVGYMDINRWRHMANTFVSLGLLQPDYELDGFLWSLNQNNSHFFSKNHQIVITLIFCTLLMVILLLIFNRRLQEQLQENKRLLADSECNKQKYELALWGGDLGYWRWDRTENALFLDEKGAFFLGGQHESCLFTLQEVKADDSLLSVQNFFKHFSDDIRKQDAAFKLEAELINDESHNRWILCHGQVLSSMSDGSIEIAHGVLLDVTDARKTRRQVEQLTITDGMTGVLNRRYFMSRLSAFMQRVKFGEGHFSIALIDIDCMEVINTKYGQPTGDYTIETLADVIQQQVRPMDLIARYAGQNFAILLPNTDSEEAFTACDRIRNYIAHHRFDTGSDSFFVSVTIGIVDTKEFSNTELNSKQLLHIAEERVKRGKIKGRDVLISKVNQGLTNI
ncbi:ABC transporter substrate-binding protein [Oceanospirillum maris]|uniref:ABC transporter substrate-binding protein n=1 Tax=Oceanospirillum maris TaxID=64977 RepID=UPI000428781C|nr:ABC transporter substrate-binding protein [Oceanospirillum maris]